MYYIIVLNTLNRIFKKKLSNIFMIIGLFLIRILNYFTEKIDLLLFKNFQNKDLSPIVIVGNPRSGTTFLHRFLVNNNFGTGIPLWKLIYQTITLQKIVTPFIKKINKINPARFHNKVAHETDLFFIETEDPAFMFRYFDGFFVYGFFLSWAEKDYKNEFDPKYRNTSSRDFKLLERIWKKHLYNDNSQQIIGKLFSISVKIEEFLNFFPNSKILYTLRDPLETVASALSLVTGVLESKYGFENIDKNLKQRFINRLYDALLELNLRFCNSYLNNTIDKNKVLIVKYNDLMNNFENIINEIIDFCGFSITEQQMLAIKNQNEFQKNYVSKHKYSLEKFGLTSEKIKKDYKLIYEKFL